MIRHLALAALTGLTTVGMALWGRYGAWVWYDNLAHCLAGACITALMAIVLPPAWAIFATTLVALDWELFEWLRNIHPWGGSTSRDAAWEDTALDMVMVWLGSALAIGLLSVAPL